MAYRSFQVNDGLAAEKQQDVASCRAFCKSESVPYFVYVLPDANLGSAWYGNRGSCWCQTSNSVRVEQTGYVSGETSCATAGRILSMGHKGIIKVVHGELRVMDFIVIQNKSKWSSFFQGKPTLFNFL